MDDDRAVRAPLILDHLPGWLLPVLASVAIKMTALAAAAVSFNSDEAVVALMARHILQGERPVFFYGQSYMGSLDAWLVAISFTLFGQTVLAVRLVQIALCVGMILAVYALAQRLTGSRGAAALAAWLLSVPPVLVLLYTTATLGGYGETLFLGSFLLLLAHRLAHEDHDRLLAWGLTGLLAGLGFWTMALIAVFLVPAAGYLSARCLMDARKRGGQNAGKLWLGAGLAAAGFVVGSSPWWIDWLTHGPTVLRDLSGSGLSYASAGGWTGYLDHLVYFFVLGLPAVFGLRPPWSAESIAPLPLAGLAAAGYLAALAWGIRRAKAVPAGAQANGAFGWWLLIGVWLAEFLAFVSTPFGADPSGRYLLPLYPALAVFAAGLIHRLAARARLAAAAFAGVLLLSNLSGDLGAMGRNPPGLTTQFDLSTHIEQQEDAQVIHFLLTHDGQTGYTDYWVAYRLAFESGEQIRLAPRLPYKASLTYTRRDDRYPLYSRLAGSATQAVYVTAHQPELDQQLRGGFRRLDVDYREAEFGPYRIFYDLSRPVPPEAIADWSEQKP